MNQSELLKWLANTVCAGVWRIQFSSIMVLVWCPRSVKPPDGQVCYCGSEPPSFVMVVWNWDFCRMEAGLVLKSLKQASEGLFHDRDKNVFISWPLLNVGELYGLASPWVCAGNCGLDSHWSELGINGKYVHKLSSWIEIKITIGL